MKSFKDLIDAVSSFCSVNVEFYLHEVEVFSLCRFLLRHLWRFITMRGFLQVIETDVRIITFIVQRGSLFVGIFTVAAVIVSFAIIGLHLKHWTDPALQKSMCRIVLMVPVRNTSFSCK
jgi:hypothetical protein